VTSTYRLQLHAGFGFADAEAQVPYLAALGVTHLYLSPVLQAVPGSMHGYDVLDHTRISSDLGGEDALVALSRTAREHGLGTVVDVVPNHMAFVAPEHANAPLWRVLQEGRDASTAHWFDIDWKAGGGRIGLPLLGSTVEEALAADEITTAEYDGHPVLRYYDHVFPIALGTEGGSPSDVLSRQHYRLASWRANDTVLNYRRFFDVDTLIAIRVELPDVFDATHALLLDLNERGVIDGFRIDHPDGLADPEGYLRRLREAARPGTPVWVEKILEGTERLPTSWACEGTTGYDALHAVTAALVDPRAAPTLRECWTEAGGDPDLARTEQRAKRLVVEDLLGPEVRRLTRRAREVFPDDDPHRLEEAVVELLVAGEVYRAYVRPERRLTPVARRRLEDAAAVATDARPDLSPEIEKLAGLAMAEPPEEESAGDSAEDFAVRLQQTWGPVMAKGIEDTTFYRWHLLVALDEVGGDPSVLEAAGPELLHAWAGNQQAHWPLGMTTLSTHDTKRSEDVRARLLALAGDPDSWRDCSQAFAEAADRHGVDRPTAHLLWQTIAGAGDIGSDRLRGYLVKALREAKLHTTWTDPDEDYEARVLALADLATAPGPMREVVDRALQDNRGAIRALVLGQKLLQLMLPGTADTYQGCETVNLSLVDPDNRRPVDFAALAARLREVEEGRRAGLDDEKLMVTRGALRVRNEVGDCFGELGAYAPLETTTEHAVGFLRGERAACVVSRAPQRLERDGGWGDHTVRLPRGSWHDELTGAVHGGGQVACTSLFAQLPVALLVSR